MNQPPFVQVTKTNKRGLIYLLDQAKGAYKFSYSVEEMKGPATLKIAHTGLFNVSIKCEDAQTLLTIGYIIGTKFPKVGFPVN